MYQLTVPWVTRSIDGVPTLTPRIPDDWVYEQASSLLDTGPLAAPTKLTVIDVRESRAKVEAWMERREADGLRALLRADWTPGRREIRERGATDRGALKEYLSSRRERARSHVRTRERAEMLRRTSAFLLPILVASGIEGLARLMGSSEGVALGMAIVAGTPRWEDDWSGGSDGDDVDGRSPNLIDLDSGVFVCVNGANSVEITSSGTRAANGGVNVTNREVTAYGTMTAVDRQFSETQGSDRNNAWISVRCATGQFQGYGVRPNAGRINRWIDPTTQNQIGIGASNSGGFSTRIEADGSDITAYLSTAGSYVGAGTAVYSTATDSTHTTGVPGFAFNNTGTTKFVNQARGGTLDAVGGGAAFPFFIYDSAGSL